MASVTIPTWIFGQQDGTIAEQLHDGVRGLLIDTYYGESTGGRVRTDLASLPKRARAVEEIGEPAVKAAERLRARIGPAGSGKRGIYLCHTFCELGATPLADALENVHDFLVLHPEQVVVVVNQDYVTPQDFVKAIGDAALAPYAFTPPRDASWPTLRTMIDDDRRLLVLAENHAGAAPWYQLAYQHLVQETPFSFSSPSQLADTASSCTDNRGPAGAPLFLVNNWVTTDPTPRPSNARQVNGYATLLARARACQRARHHLPNLIAVDFYRHGDLFRVADTLNDVMEP
jgi:hypothetical protein